VIAAEAGAKSLGVRRWLVSSVARLTTFRRVHTFRQRRCPPVADVRGGIQSGPFVPA
jgi:hypothetical protein